MGIRGPFDRIGGDSRSGTPIVDEGLGSAYELVEIVYNQLANITMLAGLTVQIQAVASIINDLGGYALTTHNHNDVYALVGHGHAMGDVVGLSTALATKQNVGDYTLNDARYAQLSILGQVNGIATLDAAGKVLTSQLPALAISKPTVVASQAAQLALVREEGDIVIRSDTKANYIHNGGIAGTMADWTLLESGTANVISVNGQFGTVILGKADVGLGNVDNTSDANKPVSIAQATAIGLKLDAAQKGAASGVATLGADSKVPLVQIPVLDYITSNLRGALNGVASLGADGKVPAVQLPVAASPSTSLAALTDVNIVSPLNGSPLEYNTVTGKWEVGVDGGSAAHLVYPSWGALSTAERKTHTHTAVNSVFVAPVGWVYAGGTALEVIADATDPGLSHVLTFTPAAGLGNSANKSFTITVNVTADDTLLRFRYRTQGEAGFDGFVFTVNGVFAFSTRSADSGWLEYSQTLAVGVHTLQFQYTSDGAFTTGYQNVRFSSIKIPGQLPTASYAMGDVVTHNGRRYMALIAGTSQEPSLTATQWAAFSNAPNGYRPGWFFTSALTASEILLLHPFTKATTFPANWAGSVATVDGTMPAAALVIDVQRNNISVGSISISTTGVATFTSTGGAAIVFAIGDRMKLVGPATVSAATNVSGTFEGTF